MLNGRTNQEQTAIDIIAVRSNRFCQRIKINTWSWKGSSFGRSVICRRFIFINKKIRKYALLEFGTVFARYAGRALPCLRLQTWAKIRSLFCSDVYGIGFIRDSIRLKPERIENRVEGQEGMIQITVVGTQLKNLLDD
jgi:hypothetical protein